jgi:hypothetical protein
MDKPRTLDKVKYPSTSSWCLVARDAGMPLRVDEASHMRWVDTLDDVVMKLRVWAATEASPPAVCRTLDLIGHSTRDHHLLRIGETPIDMFRPAVVRVFETIKTEQLLDRLGVTAVRLLGCSTAVFPTGQRSMQRLARLLKVPVYGSLKALLHAHYMPDGFNPKFAQVLIESSQLPNPPRPL